MLTSWANDVIVFIVITSGKSKQFFCLALSHVPSSVSAEGESPSWIPMYTLDNVDETYTNLTWEIYLLFMQQ